MICSSTIFQSGVSDDHSKLSRHIPPRSFAARRTHKTKLFEFLMYNSRSAHGTQTPDETIRHQAGTCRDFALLMIESARSMGFAARFVTGYVYVPDRDGPVRLGGGSTHAWCQIYVPGSGWVEFDPTNGIVGNRELIRVAVARTPHQAIPLSGTYWGDAEDELGMEVSVNVKTA
jgi:transglutaminase-like putative cysteine protease